MKKEYKKSGRLLYCYSHEGDFTVRVDAKTKEIATFDFRLSDWANADEYEECTKKEFKTALSAAIKKLREATK